jgi:hypothetical protein
MPKKRSLTLVISLLVLLTFSCGLLYGCKIDKAKETSKTEGKKTADVIKLAGGDYGYLTPLCTLPKGASKAIRKIKLSKTSPIFPEGEKL